MKSMLAGYISGTSVDLARVRDFGDRIELHDDARYRTKSYPDFESVLEQYLQKSRGAIDVACFGVAGPVIRNEVSTTNLPWHIAGAHIQDKFKISRVALLNDIVATAHGLSQITSEKFYTINEGAPGENGNLALLAAGAGLGEALIYRKEGDVVPYASEGGHADFAPGNQREAELWEYLYSEQGNVEVEDVLSLAGLERIYMFLIETGGGSRADWFKEADEPAMAIIEKALAGEDRTAEEAVTIFIDCFASEAANLALTGMTLGGVYIGGLIAPQIITLMDQGRFMQRFVKPGKMESLLANMPVNIVIEEKTALLGAAGVTVGM